MITTADIMQQQRKARISKGILLQLVVQLGLAGHLPALCIVVLTMPLARLQIGTEAGGTRL